MNRRDVWVSLLCIVLGLVSVVLSPVEASESYSCCNYSSDCSGSLMCCNPALIGLPPCTCGPDPLVGYCRSSCVREGQ